MKNPSPAALSRRDFIGRASLGAAAVALAPHIRAAELPPPKLGIAIVGLGGYASGQLAPALKLTQNVQITAVVTGSPEKGRNWSQVFGFPEKAIYSYDTMARLADNPTVDIVYVVTPNALHKDHVIAAAKAGKHVITEKPMGVSVAECDAMIAACKAAKVKLSVGYRLHFDPYFAEIAKLAKDKEVGPFKKMTGGFGFTMAQPQWRAEKKLAGGGPLMDLGIYSLQAACMMMGDQAPASIVALEQPKKRPEFFRDVEETIEWVMDFEGGARGEFVTSYNGGINRFRAESDKGWAQVEPAFSYGGLKGETSKGPLSFEPVSQQARQLDHIAQCMREGRESEVPGEMGRRDLRIIEAIYQSAAQNGKRMELKG
jgi:glucose-fructose oxidoreductase